MPDDAGIPLSTGISRVARRFAYREACPDMKKPRQSDCRGNLLLTKYQAG